MATADACAKAGLKISPLPEHGQKQIREFLEGKVPLSPARGNPVDLVWVSFADANEVYGTCLEIMAQAVDSCLTICYAFLEDGSFLSHLESIRDRNRKPIIVVPGNSIDQRQGMFLAVRRGIPAYAMPENAVRVLETMTQRAEYLNSFA